MKIVIQLLAFFLPWPLRRRVLAAAFGFQLDPTSRIGLAWVAPGRLILETGASIGHFTVCKGLDLLHLGAHASIGRGNWITGLGAAAASAGGHFAHQPDRVSALVLGEHAAVTHRHLIDCTDRVEIGARTTLAGFRSQILTHSIDLARNRQHAAPVVIGPACFVGTGVIVLAGSILPACSVLGAGSLLNKAHRETHRLYAGVPARPMAPLDPGLAYFHRPTGFVV